MFERPLSLIFYVDGNHRSAKIYNFIQMHKGQRNVEIIYTIDNLCCRMKQNGKKDLVAVLFISGRCELAEIVTQSTLLRAHKVILALPDRSSESASLGHALYPRFMSYTDGDLQEVNWVLQRLLMRGKSYSAAVK